MTQRTQYLIQILDKIGGPLMDAVSTVGNSDFDTAVESDAKTVASLLGKVVEVSISMNDAMDLNAQDAQDDALRVALAALAGPLVAGQYRQNARVPQENDLKRIGAAMQAVLTFGDNFTPSPEHEARLKDIEASGAPVDGHQINIQYVHAFIPVINAVGNFSFGQPEQKLIMDISDRLVRRAVEMRETLMPSLGADDQKLAELAILRALTSVYASCHTNETQRLSKVEGEAPDVSSLDPVWAGFDTRSAMLEAVVKNILPDDGSAVPIASAPTPTTTATTAEPIPASAAPMATSTEALTAPPSEAPQDTPAKPAIFGGGGAATTPAAQPEAATQTPPAPLAEPAAPAAPTAQPSTEAPAGGNPMSFFGAPKTAEDGEVPTPPPAEAPVTPPVAAPETPPAAPVQPPAPPPETPPPQTPPAETPAQEEKSAGGDPMSFFTKKDDED